MKRGFTLVELLAVITILSLVGLIASISVASMIKNSKSDLSEAQIKSIKIAAESWASDNVKNLPTKNNCSFITLKDLKEEGLLDSNLKDLKTRNNISDDIKIKITSKGKKLEYEIDSKDISNCTYIGSELYVDLPKGLTPVIYDENNWKVVDKSDPNWYNYDEQKWANAVVLGKDKIKKIGEVVTVDGENPDALMMLVYIPRFEYKIEGQYGTHTDETVGTKELPGEIDVKFINNSQNESDSDYILHPAFTFGDKEISGIWVGKFELSHSDDLKSDTSMDCRLDTCSEAQYLRVLPNKKSLRQNSISSFWYGIKSIENTNLFGLSKVDIHMIKNSEWGAVAYLSQSRYGKYGNKDYKNEYKEIYQNKSYNYTKTGLSNGTPSQTDINTQCEYNDMTSLGEGKGVCGPGASTTGNIYGVYDMSGGTYEYVMGVYGDDDGIYSGNSSSSNSGFKGKLRNNDPITDGVDVPDPKYYDIYKTEDALTACNNNGPCLGHALSETNGWYTDNDISVRILWYGPHLSMVNLSHPWFKRGGNNGNGINGGIFSIDSEDGPNSYFISTRFVGVAK